MLIKLSVDGQRSKKSIFYLTSALVDSCVIKPPEWDVT